MRALPTTALLNIAVILGTVVGGLVVLREGSASGSDVCIARHADEPPLQSLAVSAAEATGALTMPLEPGVRYDLILSGAYVDDAHGHRSDGRYVLVDGLSISSRASANRAYCLELVGFGKPLALAVRDLVYEDNKGSLRADLYLVEGRGE